MEWKEWVKTPEYKNVVYYWGNDLFSLGYGRTHLANGNNRVNPLLSHKQLKKTKDSGKTFYALFMGKLVKKQPKLYYMPDNSERTSYISSELEELVKKGGKFIKYNDTTLSKRELANEIVIPTIENHYGKESNEAMLARLAGADADLWGRFYGDNKCSEAMDNIMEEFLWVDQ